MTKRPTDGIRRTCGIVEGMRDNEFAEATVRKAAVAEECDRRDEAVEAVRQDMWDDGFEAGRERSAEDREAAAWVRDHGGLYQVKIDYDVYEGFSGLVDRIAERLGVSVEGLDDQDAEPIVTSALDRRLMPEDMEWLVDSWPRFEDNAPVKLLDDFERYGEENGVSAVTMYADGSFALNCRAYSRGERVKRPAPKVRDADGAEIRVGDTVYALCDGTKHVVERIEGGNIKAEGMTYLVADKITHRAPVLAADGKPLREGETVYKLDDDKPYTLKRFDGDHVYINAGGSPFDIWTFPNKLTHRAPFLAVDDKPLLKGETVWSVDSGTRYTVEEIEDGLIPIKCRSEMGSTVLLHPSQLIHQRILLDADGVPVKDTDTVWLTDGRGPWKVSRIVCADRWRVVCDDDENGHLNAYPEQLTHERPESWDRLMDDAKMPPETYCVNRGIDIADVDGTHRVLDEVTERMARDLVRRCRALAERERGE